MDKQELLALTGELSVAIRVNLYRHASGIPSYPEGIVPKVVKPYLEEAFAAGRQQGLREAAEVARGKAESVREKARRDQKTTDGRGGLVLGYEDAATAITALMEGEGK